MALMIFERVTLVPSVFGSFIETGNLIYKGKKKYEL